MRCSHTTGACGVVCGAVPTRDGSSSVGSDIPNFGFFNAHLPLTIGNKTLVTPRLFQRITPFPNLQKRPPVTTLTALLANSSLNPWPFLEISVAA